MITLPIAFVFLGAAATGFGTFWTGVRRPAERVRAHARWSSVWLPLVFHAFHRAVTSSVSMLQPVMAFFEEGFGLKRRGSSAILCLICALGCGFVLYFSGGLTALDTFDFWVGTFLIYLLAMFQALLYGWIFGIERGEYEAHQGAHIRIPRFVQYMLKYVVPVYLLVIFCAFVYEKIPSKTEDLFESSASHIDSFQDGTLGDPLRSEFADQGQEVPDAATVVAGRKPGDLEDSWRG